MKNKSAGLKRFALNAQKTICVVINVFVGNLSPYLCLVTINIEYARNDQTAHKTFLIYDIGEYKRQHITLMHVPAHFIADCSKQRIQENFSVSL